MIARADPVNNAHVGGSIVGGTGDYVGARGTFTSIKRGSKDIFDDTLTLLP